MRYRLSPHATLILTVSACWWTSSAAAQTATRSLAANVIVPQAALRSAVNVDNRVVTTRITANIDIHEQVATTTLNIHLRNEGHQATEAEVLVPVPDGAVLRGFAFAGTADKPTAEVLARPAAREVYDSIVARLRDPALVEFAGLNLIRSSVFPIPANGEQQLRLVYEHVLPRDGQRVDYILPRTESLQYAIPWEMAVNVHSQAPIATVYSPSHKLTIDRQGPGQLRIKNTPDATTTPGSFRLSYLLGGDSVTASLLAYPSEGEDGGFFSPAGRPAGR
jgi:hypothetical protein